MTEAIEATGEPAEPQGEAMTPSVVGTSLIIRGDCVAAMKLMNDASIDVIVTDPPYGLGFMGKEWDTIGDTGRGARARIERASEVTPRGKGHSTSAGPYLAVGVDSLRSAGQPFQEWCRLWATEALRVLKPGGHLLAFGGTRTYHRLTSGIEDAGFEIRDCLAWLYGQGFPKSHNVSKAIDKAARGVPHGGVDPTSANHGKYRTQATEGKRDDNDAGQGYGAGPGHFMREAGTQTNESTLVPEAAQWEGWGTALKPAHEPIVLARKPLAGTVAANVLEHGTGALNIGATKIGTEARVNPPGSTNPRVAMGGGWREDAQPQTTEGRWPANVVLDEPAAAQLDAQTGDRAAGRFPGRQNADPGDGRTMGGGWTGVVADERNLDSGGPSRFFYCAKASKRDRGPDNKHPTVKPVELMRWLVRLATPPGGVVLDPFAGSGSTGVACAIESVPCILIELDAESVEIIERRLTEDPRVAEAAEGGEG